MATEPNKEDLLGYRAFEAAEHEAIGNAIQLIQDKGKAPVKSFEFPLKVVEPGSSQIPLFFGRVIALAGDFYTTHDANSTPISGGPEASLPAKPYNKFKKDPSSFGGQRERFLSAAGSLSGDTDKYLGDISNMLNREDKGVNEIRDENDPHENVAQGYHKHSHDLPGDMAFVWATTKVKTLVASKYTLIAWTNFDHFNVDAVTAYGVGHSIALEKAVAAGKIQDASKRQEDLRDAYYHEAFAAHYLTDMFSSGHNRAPRRKLHNPSYAKAGYELEVAGHWTNDAQCRCMHDDDSASGLLVSNAMGQEWIAFGDKQFFSPQNSVNRFYSIGALQGGVQEVTNAFNDGNQPAPEDYVAIKLAPSPALSYSSILKDIPTYDSIAPLWVWDDNKNTYSVRASIHDHSDFSSRPPANPTSATGVCDEIKHSTYFRDGDNDQFPDTAPLTPLTGGFVHIQELPIGEIGNVTGSVFSLNSWGTVDLPDVVKAGSRKLSFTLRNRSRAFDSVNTSAKQLPLCWKKVSQGNKTWLVRFDYNQTANSICCSSFQLDTNQPDQTSQKILIKDLDKYPVKVASTGFKSQNIASGIPNVNATNLMRFFIAPVLSNSSTGSPNLLSIGWLNNNGAYQAKISIATTSADIHDPQIKIQYTDPTTRSDGDLGGRFKLYKGEKDATPRIIHAGSKSNSCPVTREWAIANDSSITASGPSSGSSSVPETNQTLVGDISGAKYDQLATLAGKWPAVSITVLASSTSGQPWIQMSSSPDGSLDKKYAFQTSSSLAVNEHYITALIPRYSETSDDRAAPLRPGLNILQVSSVKESGKNYLNFRTIVGTSKDFVGIRDSITPEGKPYIVDEFYGNPNYFSIAWLRASQEIPNQDIVTQNAILQVFSFYGVLGVRVFAPMTHDQAGEKHNPTFDNYGPYWYKLVGQSAFMGTPSLGMGMGSDGSWNYGILPWGEFGEWIDVNIWNQSKQSWLMSAADEKRANIRGWDVKARPT